MQKQEEILKTINEDINSKLDQLTLTEQQIINVLKYNKKLVVENKLNLIKRLGNKISDTKNKTMIVRSADKLLESFKSEKFNSLTYKTFELQEAVKSILESENGEPASMKLKDYNYIKNTTMSIIEDINNPSTIFINFTLTFYPEGESFMKLKNKLEDLETKLTRIGRSALNQTIFWKNKQGQYFTGGGIWDVFMRTEGVKVGKPVIARIEWALHTEQDPSSPKSFGEFKTPAEEILADLDPLLGSWFKELDSNNQADYMKYVDKGSNRSKTLGADEDDEKKINLKHI